jgi:predicted Zn-dependent protease
VFGDSIGDVVGTLVTSGYSREAEGRRQLGRQFLAGAGYDPQALRRCSAAWTATPAATAACSPRTRRPPPHRALGAPAAVRRRRRPPRRARQQRFAAFAR